MNEGYVARQRGHYQMVHHGRNQHCREGIPPSLAHDNMRVASNSMKTWLRRVAAGSGNGMFQDNLNFITRRERQTFSGDSGVIECLLRSFRRAL
jgi:hypothetical protein